MMRSYGINLREVLEEIINISMLDMSLVNYLGLIHKIW